MTIYYSIPEYNMAARNFEYWGYTKQITDELTDADWDIIEKYFDDIGYDNVSDSDLCGYFYDNCDHIATLLGYKHWADLIESRHGNS